MQITSLQNKRIKDVVRLRSRRHRDARQLTVVEGGRETVRALTSGVLPVEAYVCPELVTEPEAETAVSLLRQLASQRQTQLFNITPELFAKIAYRGQSGGVLMVIPYRRHSLADLGRDLAGAGFPPFLAIIEAVEKPGNFGAILRTADAAGVSGVILTQGEEQGTDVHNPNVIRASLGALFTLPVVTAVTAQAIDWLRAQQIRIVATTPAATAPYTAVDLTGPVAVALGSEAHGLSDAWLAAADEWVVVPMQGVVDSLNLSVSTAILLYEVVRQRSERAAGSAA